MLYVQLLQTVTMVSAELDDLQNQYTAELQYVIVIELSKKITRGNSGTNVYGSWRYGSSDSIVSIGSAWIFPNSDLLA